MERLGPLIPPCVTFTVDPEVGKFSPSPRSAYSATEGSSSVSVLHDAEMFNLVNNLVSHPDRIPMRIQKSENSYLTLRL